MKHIAHTLSLGLLVISLTNCTSVRVVEKEPRRSIRFANAEAADTFYRALITKTTPSNDHSELTVAFYIPLPYRHRTIPSDDKQFNRFASEADSNANGIITLTESQRYAATIADRSEA